MHAILKIKEFSRHPDHNHWATYISLSIRLSNNRLNFINMSIGVYESFKKKRLVTNLLLFSTPSHSRPLPKTNTAASETLKKIENKTKQYKWNAAPPF